MALVWDALDAVFIYFSFNVTINKKQYNEKSVHFQMRVLIPGD